ncbi:uncharacterized protein VTP21DRAFT_10046 [Calcarisporiella thermophila]|uniref:uncharacterized protein n=1 Tax=Calcarisporiella thermophila TaxID=911321 RepID=UPI0037434EBA
MEQWIKEPNLVIPPVKYGEIFFDTVEGNSRRIKRRLISKRPTKDPVVEECIEISEKAEGVRATFTPQGELPFYYPKVKAFSFILSEINGVTKLCMEIMPLEKDMVVQVSDKMRSALKQLFHTLFRWCVNTSLGYKKRMIHDQLVPKDRFRNKYERLKSKYADRWVRNWPEKTDPRKFVYEDLLIASFIISLWELEGSSGKFVELGCGNGLLTHILCSEGYEGFGIDLAKRKVWDLYENTSLVVETLNPPHLRYEGVEWFIGNHADEMIPWIPIVATRSGPDCKVFVIPCCFFALSGKKHIFSAEQIRNGRYESYLAEIERIMQLCGFRPQRENLRIPSTKNVGIVGRRHDAGSYEQALYSANKLASCNFLPRKSDREKDIMYHQKKEMRDKRMENNRPSHCV